MGNLTNEIFANNPLIIVDVGASGGVHERWDNFTSCYKGVLFEPDPREYEVLKSKCGEHLIVLNAALAESKGTLELNLCKKQTVSSPFPPNFDLINQFPDADRFEVTKTIEIDADTLDNQLQSHKIDYVDFIKVDTQGFELSILKGSMATLDDVIGLEIEVEFAPLYSGQPLFNEVDAFAMKHGFHLFDIKRHYMKRKGSVGTGDQKGQLIFGDALYFKTPEQILAMKGLTEEKVARTIGVYLAYGYLDLAQTLFKMATEQQVITSKNQQLKNLLAASQKRRLPDFKGKDRVRMFLQRLSEKFSLNVWHAGNDQELGN